MKSNQVGLVTENQGLSGGQQRVAPAQTLAREPKVLLVDASYQCGEMPKCLPSEINGSTSSPP